MWAGRGLALFILLSCLGTLGGVVLISLDGVKGRYPTFYLLSLAWLLHYHYGVHLGKLGAFSFDISVMPTVTLYGMYIPLLLGAWRYVKGKARVLLFFGILASTLMICASLYAHGYLPYLASLATGTVELPLLPYLLVYTALILYGIKRAKRHPLD
jgi:hypothetical protein